MLNFLNLFFKAIRILDLSERRKLLYFIALIGLIVVLELLSTISLPVFISAVTTSTLIPKLNFLHKIFPDINSNSINLIYYLGAFILVIFTIKNALNYIFDYFLAHFITRNRNMVSRKGLKFYTNKEYSFHLYHPSSDTLRNIDTETNKFMDFVILPIISNIKEGLLLMFLATVIILYSYKITLLFFLVFSLVFFKLFFKIRKELKAVGIDNHNERFNNFIYIKFVIDSIKDILILNRTQNVFQEFEVLQEKLKSSENKKMILNSSVSRFIETFAIYILVLLIFILLNINVDLKEITTILVFFTIVLLKILPTFNKIVQNSIGILTYKNSINILYNNLYGFKEDKADIVKKNIFPFHKSLKFKNVNFYHDQTPILKNINLNFEYGSTVALVGASGAGKSTILDLFSGLLKPNQGEFLIDGVSFTSLKFIWGDAIGYIPQNIYFKNDSIKNNIALCLNETMIDMERVLDALKLAQLSSFCNQLPEGLNTTIGDNGFRLSSGQKQRIGIARALYNRPQILLMDEATSSLDSITEYEIFNELSKITFPLTKVIITHNLSIIKNVDQIYFIDNGCVTDSGTYESLFEGNPKFRSLAKVF